MRTTLTIDDDLAMQLERLRTDRGATFKQLVNDALRLGVAALQRGPARTGPYRTRPVSLGRPRLPDVDNVAEVLSVSEGDSFR